MAGSGRRFAAVGYAQPKALLPMPDGRPLISWVIDHLPRFNLFTIGLRAEQRTLTNGIITARIRAGTSGGRLLWIDAPTGGPLGTVLTARRYLAGREELLISYCDCFLAEGGADAFVEAARDGEHDAVGVVFESEDSRFGRTPDGQWAVGGIFWFREARTFVQKAHRVSAPAAGVPDVLWQCNYGLAPRLHYVDLGIPKDYEAFLARTDRL
jgi:NDP-sugar pyrophosphorylase family protein